MELQPWESMRMVSVVSFLKNIVKKSVAQLEPHQISNLESCSKYYFWFLWFYRSIQEGSWTTTCFYTWPSLFLLPKVVSNPYCWEHLAMAFRATFMSASSFFFQVGNLKWGAPWFDRQNKEIVCIANCTYYLVLYIEHYLQPASCHVVENVLISVSESWA